METSILTLSCGACGKLMRVAGEHVQTLVACPHCGQVLEPWRAAQNSPIRSALVYDYAVSDRSKVLAGILGILFGAFGVHRFYLGFIGIGILQVVVTMLTFGFGGIWGFIEGILCLVGKMRDVDGLLLRD